jgi:hypothetical protein
MKDKPCRACVIENLKKWYVIDSILLNEHANRVFLRGEDFRQYTMMKAALLSNLYEYYQHVGYVPKLEKLKNTKMVQESAVKLAKVGKASASKMLQNKSVKESIKHYLMKEAKEHKIKDYQDFSKKVISERFLRMSLDNVLIGLPLLESKNVKAATDFKGEILEEAYRVIRNSLVYLAKTAPKK